MSGGRRRSSLAYESASNEALTAFGDGSVFIERYVDLLRHVEVQISADGTDTIHPFERDCLVQRRHQKVVEVAPAIGLPDDVTKALWESTCADHKGRRLLLRGTHELCRPEDVNHRFIEVRATTTWPPPPPQHTHTTIPPP